MTMNPRVTIKDVAAEAKVSPTTVSHVISGNRQVSEETARRVREVIERLGYTPAYAAQVLQSGSTMVIGLLVPDVSNHFFAALAKGVEGAARGWGYSVVLGNTDFDAGRELNYLEMIGRRSIDALVYAAGSPPAPDELRALTQGFPIALVDEEILGLAAVTAVADHGGGGSLAGRHLRELGHRRALVVCGPEELRSSHDRLEGFRLAFGGEILPYPGDYRQEAGYRAIRAQAERESAPSYTAVFALNDLMALGAMAALRELGLHVPGEVSIVGFDDIPTAALMNPPLTTVRQPAYLIGATATDRLLSLIHERRPLSSGERHVLPVELIKRESSAPVGSAVRPGATADRHR